MAKKEEEEKANRQKENEQNANNSKENFCRSENLAEDFARSSNHLPLNHALNEKGEIVRFERNWPKVHVAARCTEKDNFFSAGYCTHWPDGQFRGGRSFRFAPFPVTLFRAELAAIEEALREAVDASIQNVIIVTSSAHFMRAWSRRWECTKVVKADEGVERIEKSAFSGRIFFDRICDLCEQLSHVHFQFEKEDANAELAKELERKCAQGLSYPLVGKDLTEYRLEIDDLVQSKECRRDGIPIIRLFKSGTEFNAGYTWKSDDLNSANSCVGTPSVLVRILEEAVKRNQLEITIRADSEKLIKSFEARLEIWRRNGWRNRQHKRIGKLAEWENAWNLKQKVDVIWEFMDPPDDEDRKENEKIPKYKKASK
uniref:RNase H type-1 domain-containing protein n=1 Tax=Caenorhabditis japonica TaxID=281687 RepID=A0A8R1DKT6_CAEJA